MYVNPKEPPKPRYEKQVFEAIKQGNSTFAISPSVICLLKEFDMIDDVTIDTMHAAYLGVFKMLLNYWFHSNYYQETFSLRSMLKEIDLYIENARLPHDLSRQPRFYINKGAHWKGKGDFSISCLLLFSY